MSEELERTFRRSSELTFDLVRVFHAMTSRVIQIAEENPHCKPLRGLADEARAYREAMYDPGRRPE